MSRPVAASPAGVPYPEIELLLCCARTHTDAADEGRIRALLSDGIDWEQVMGMVSRHGTLPLLYWNLNAICPEAVPEATLTRLRALFQANARRNLYLTGELLQLLQLLRTHDIGAIPFKGPVLAATIYGNLALRQFIDLDILVRERQAIEAQEVLISQGYRLWGEPAAAQEPAWPLAGGEQTLTHDEKRVGVDLHRAIIDRTILRGLDGEGLWERLEPVSLGGATVHSLPPEELLLALCAHAAKHGPTPSGRLVWFCDVAELIALYPELDWGRVTQQARRLGGQRILYLGLRLARDLLGASLPNEMQQKVEADPVVAALVAQVRLHLFAAPNAPGQGAGRYAFYLKMRERWRDRVSCLFYLARDRHKLTPNARDRAWVPLPAALAFLYYPLRPLRLVRDRGLRESIALWVGKEI